MSDNIYESPSTTDPVAFCQWLGKRWRQAYKDRRRDYGPATSNYASSIGHECLKYLYLQRVGAERKPHTPETMAVFERGNVIERETVDFLRTEVGVEWARSQMSVPKDSLNIGMRIDGGMRGRRNESDPYLISEVKTANANQFHRITDGDPQGIHDMLRSKAWWIRRHPYQAACYLHYLQEPAVVIIIREPASWAMKAVPLLLDSPIYEKLWGEIEVKAKFINACVEANDCPEPIPYSRSICGMCDYHEVSCFPERQHEGVEVLTHDDIVDAAERYLSLKEKAKEAEEARGYLRDIVLATGHDHVVIGQGIEAKVRKSGKGKAVFISRISGSLFFDEDDDE